MHAPSRFIRLPAVMAGLLAGALLLGAPAQAEDSAAIGFVKTSEGVAHVLAATGSDPVLAAPGTPIHMGDTLTTGADGAMGVTFKDDTVISLGTDTELTVDEFVYQPREGNLGFQTSMTQGTAQFVSGVIAHLAPEKVAVKTPGALIGVRGTHFLVKVEK